MKRTTYIFMGLLVSGLLIIVATVIFISMSGKPYREDGIFVGDEQTQMELNGIHVINVFTSQDGVPETKRVFVSGEMDISSSDASSGKEEISYPKGKFLKVTQKNDTLLMELDLNVNNIPEKLQHKDHVFMYGLHVNLVVDSLTTIIANTVKDAK